MLFPLVALLTLAMARGAPDHRTAPYLQRRGLEGHPTRVGQWPVPHSCHDSVGPYKVEGDRWTTTGLDGGDGLLQPEPLVSQKLRQALS